MILETWTKFRPNFSQQVGKGPALSKQQSKKQQQQSRRILANKKKNYEQIYGESFITKLLAQIKVKPYSDKLRDKYQQMKEQNQENAQKGAENFTHKLQDQLASKNAENSKNQEGGEGNFPKEEFDMIDKILHRFILMSDGTKKDQIDLKLVLRALPQKVDENNVYRIPMYDFQVVQKSLIAFQNDDQDELFNYYDSKSKMRLRKLTKKANYTKSETLDLKQIGSSVLSILNKIIYVGSHIKRDIMASNSPQKLKNIVKEKDKDKEKEKEKKDSFLPPIYPRRMNF